MRSPGPTRMGTIMRRSIVVTDLTRFSNPEIVCMAGTDCRDGQCVRPMPYLTTAKCRELRLAPGIILAGDFFPALDAKGPHQEDYWYQGLRAEGQCTTAEFRTALRRGLFESVEKGFEIELVYRQKHIPLGHPVKRSIITISVAPARLAVVGDSGMPEKVKLHFVDQSGRNFSAISITDLGFHTQASEHHARNALMELNRQIQSQREVLLRVGLSRDYSAPDGRRGYWLQVNGVYAFPDFPTGIRVCRRKHAHRQERE